MISFQRQQKSSRQHHVEHLAKSLTDTYAALLCHQSLILAINSSYTVHFVSKLEKQMSHGIWYWALYKNTISLFEDTLLILVSKDLYKLQILKEMTIWMSKDNSYLQERVLVIICKVLRFASRKVRDYTSIDAPCLGVLAAELSLLYSHTDLSIVQQASLAVYYLLCTAKRQLAQQTSNKQKATMQYSCGNSCALASDSEFQPGILKQDKTKLAQSIGQNLLPSLLTDFVLYLLTKLSTSDQQTTTKAASILKLTLKYHAQKVTRVSQMVDTIYKQLNENPSYFIKDVLLEVVTLLTQTSPKSVVFQLLEYPVPADKAVMLMWQAVGTKPQAASQVLKVILLVLKDKPCEVEDNLQEEKCFILDTSNMMPLAASQALCLLLPINSYKKTVAQFFAELFMALMFQLLYISQLRVQPKNRLLYARDALRILLNCSGLQQVDMSLSERFCWSHIYQGYYYHDGVNLIARTLCDYDFPQFPETLYYLHKILVQGPRRSEEHFIIVTFFIRILDKFCTDPLPELFLVFFRKWISDSNPEISKLSLQKISHMAPVVNKTENVYSLLTSILDAFASKDDTVVIQALITLRRLVENLDKVTYSSLCTKIASSYFRLMDHHYGTIRSLAIRHFAELLRDMSQEASTLKNMLGGFAPLILCLEDKDTRVVSACKYTLTICDSQLEWPISNLLKDESYNFELVVIHVCNYLIVSHESCVTYLICDALKFLGNIQVHLRRAAVILLGYLAQLGGHLLYKDEIAVMAEAVERMFQEDDPEIHNLAEITHNLLKKIANRSRSATIKHAIQRFFKFSYSKELKLLYNWKSTTEKDLKEIVDQETFQLPQDPPPSDF
ncbi:maestro heat-like repeat-containing protein family member 9 [Octodon degus]|uniref:Maestro heat-like repeat-containing protein family member 9 n=1 Tax=Octodon degus TaxID=10160 RepID=A0A6P6E5B2_OCTDE|nr:maestro heat-like repeat-containing protein family member 9 [Octodon degus]